MNGLRAKVSGSLVSETLLQITHAEYIIIIIIRDPWGLIFWGHGVPAKQGAPLPNELLQRGICIGAKRRAQIWASYNIGCSSCIISVTIGWGVKVV